MQLPTTYPSISIIQPSTMNSMMYQIELCFVAVVLILCHLPPSSGDVEAASLTTSTYTDISSSSNSSSSSNLTRPEEDSERELHQGLHLASLRFDYVSLPLIISSAVLVAGLLKILFHYARFLSSRVPESCLLIVFGIIVGGILYATGVSEAIRMDHRTFFLFLLPPIVLDSAYCLHDRVFAENIGTILLYAVLGTLINFILLGPTLWGLAKAGLMGSLSIGLVDCLLFSSFIVAVDPVSVLAIFQDIGVNNVLYFLVFGESLLNDAVTIVLSETMKTFSEIDVITWRQVALGVGAFFTDSVGGLAVGCIMGLLTALITRTTCHVRVVEPLAIVCMAYLSYLCAELVHWSGIISMIGCGLVQSQYAFHNISRNSHTTVTNLMKMLSLLCDSIIFMYLGIELVETEHVWNTGFVLWTLLFILVYRAVSTFGLTLLANMFDRIHPVSIQEQFIMFYGGLRGAICYALCSTIRDGYQHKSMFLTTAIIVVMFTVFIQGISISPLVNLCNIKRQEEDSGMVITEINKRVVDHCMSGIEIITDQPSFNYFRSVIVKLNDVYLRRLFQNDPRTHNEMILEVYKSVSISAMVNELENGIELTRPTLLGQNNDSEDAATSLPIGQEIEMAVRRQSLASLRRRTGSVDVQMGNNPTAENIRKLLAETDIGQETLHQRYDRNSLSQAEDCDFVAQLSEKHTRDVQLIRYRRRSSLKALHRELPSRDTNGRLSPGTHSPCTIVEVDESQCSRL